MLVRPCGIPPETGRSISISSSFSFRVVRASGRGEAAGGREGGDSPLAGASNSEFRLVPFARVPLFCAQARGFQGFLHEN